MIFSDQFQVRPLAAGDQEFLEEMLFESLFVPPGGEPFSRSILDQPELAKYARNWGAENDIGVIASDGTRPVGAAWARLFRPDEPGYGFVDDVTPELGIAIVR